MDGRGCWRSETIFDVTKLKTQIAEFENRTTENEFWSDPESANKILQELARLRERLSPYEGLKKAMDDLDEWRSLAEDSPDPGVEAEIERQANSILMQLNDVEMATLLGGEHDRSNAVLEVNAGAGGTEATDWAAMLLRMYMRWAQNRTFSIEIVDETPGDVTGYRTVSLVVEGAFAYGYLKGEAGVHRLVRISPFNAAGKRQTSFARVSVLPEVEGGAVDIKSDDLRVDTFRASGAGGQHVNKTDSAVRITHIPTGIVVSCQNERSQFKNRATAMKVLEARLAVLERNKTEQTLSELRGEVASADWGHSIRSYVLQPYTVVKDVRTDFETGNAQGVLDGDLDGFIESYLRSLSKDAAGRSS